MPLIITAFKIPFQLEKFFIVLWSFGFMKRYVVTGAVAFRPREWIKWHLLSRFNGSPTHYFCPSNIKLSCGEALFSLAGLFCEIDRSHGLLIMTVLASSFTLSLNGDTVILMVFVMLI